MALTADDIIRIIEVLGEERDLIDNLPTITRGQADTIRAEIATKKANLGVTIPTVAAGRLLNSRGVHGDGV